MDTNKMRDISREQFESFARDVLDWADDEFRLASDGKSYYWGATGEAWVFWQASRAAVVVELPPKWNDATHSNKQAWDCGIDDARMAIEAQGLNVEVKP
ncbi:hypothetical protein ABJB81_006080 [Pseudomonas putida]|uniref:hypothetical protein n=1 Tax=Pseudomonas TaxID=286 RepID=UPI0006DB1179|nr:MULTISPECIES: hypothetical protein [Pseudomonas]KPM64133.1 hypothetical protein HB4184_11025 [Pseudomonas putida]MCE1084666.1 hypothetical protein [Pseudomonas asiatica]MCF3156620.1 hypothetical protein [Pseudomonas juntendi]